MRRPPLFALVASIILMSILGGCGEDEPTVGPVARKGEPVPIGGEVIVGRYSIPVKTSYMCTREEWDEIDRNNPELPGNWYDGWCPVMLEDSFEIISKDETGMDFFLTLNFANGRRCEVGGRADAARDGWAYSTGPGEGPIENGDEACRFIIHMDERGLAIAPLPEAACNSLCDGKRHILPGEMVFPLASWMDTGRGN